MSAIENSDSFTRRFFARISFYSYPTSNTCPQESTNSSDRRGWTLFAVQLAPTLVLMGQIMGAQKANTEKCDTDEARDHVGHFFPSSRKFNSGRQCV